MSSLSPRPRSYFSQQCGGVEITIFRTLSELDTSYLARERQYEVAKSSIVSEDVVRLRVAILGFEISGQFQPIRRHEERQTTPSRLGPAGGWSTAIQASRTEQSLVS
jgi:hypothetical protein